MITGEITSAEWAHFRTFAVRVREMSIYQPAGVDPLVWTILARKCQGEPLLPRLRLIDAYEMLERDISMLTCILTPSLLSANLHFEAPRNPPSRSLLCAGMKVLLQTLVDTAPGLTELCWDSPCDRGFGMGFLTRIGGLRNLRALTLTQRETSLELPIHVPTTLFQALASNPQLRSLILDLGRMELEPGMKVGATSALEELRTLCVRGGPTETITTLVHSLRVPALRSLEVDHAFMYQVPFAALRDQLSKPCANLPPTLQSFMWANLGNPTPTVDVTAPSDISCALGPLLRFTYLRHLTFTISATSWLHTTDDGLAQLAAAWPNIQVLRVTLQDSTARVSVNNTHPTIAALVTFAQRCPVLWSLSLPSLDFSSVHPTVFLPLIPRHPLSRLSISTAVCGGASAVQAAVSLNRLFPELEYLGVWSAHLSGPGDPGASGAFRSQIRGIMDALRGVREHERMRAELLVAEGERRTG